MEKNIKIGLSRNRLFEFQNCVCFSGEYKEDFLEREMLKAIKMLSVREPLIAASIELDEEKNAWLQLERVEQTVEFVDADINNFLKQQKKLGLNFEEALFKFFVVNKKTLVILAHTVVADIKSLLILAEELLLYYNKESVLVEPKEIKLFSCDNELPKEVKSFVADRVTEVLNNDWLMKPKSFSFEAMKKARGKFLEQTGEVCSARICIDKTLSEKLYSKCEKLKVDFSSCVLFGIMKVLQKNTQLSKKNRKANVQLDRRPYFVDFASYSVGALNGTLFLELPESKGDLEKQLKEFHKSYYNKYSSCFNSFYGEIFLNCLEPEFLDSTFMYKAGEYRSKPTKKLATLYGCDQQFLLSFSSVNLKQASWEKLSTFHHIYIKEPHKSNENVSLSLVMGEENMLFVEWNPTVNSKFNSGEFFEELMSFFEQL